LRAAGADATAANAKGESSIQLAERYKREADERAQKAAERQAQGPPGKVGAPRPDPSEKILSLLTKDSEEPLEVLKQKYAPELVEKVVIDSPDAADDDDVDDDVQAPEPTKGGAEDAPKAKSPKGGRDGDGTLHQILDAIKELSSRVARLEHSRIVRPGAEVNVGGAAYCAACGAGGAAACAMCHREFCAPCNGKGDVHTGCVT
jgi:hypothetical protein